MSLLRLSAFEPIDRSWSERQNNEKNTDLTDVSFSSYPPLSKPADFDWVRFNPPLIFILTDTKRQIWLTQGWT